ncbi:MAG TPA: Ig-like domain repeat protein, partial [Streptosporangiaceae bacterium]|nr:Ig-like domain repeat protein [Streptosporangiaceae bacterium]
MTAPASAAVGTPFAVNISVTPDSGTGTPTGRVVVWGPTAVLCRTVLSGGDATCTMTENGAGKLPLQVRYLGDVNDLPSVANVSVTITGGVAGTPVFTTDSPPLTATAGGSYSYAFAASGTPAPTYSLTGAPPWLAINPTSGQVTGTVPTSATGSFFYSVTATNTAGSTTVGPFVVSLGTSGG